MVKLITYGFYGGIICNPMHSRTIYVETIAKQTLLPISQQNGFEKTDFTTDGSSLGFP